MNGWPKCFVLAYKIIRDIAWKIRIEHNGENQWVPSPRDLNEITWSISTPSFENIEWKKMGAPSDLIRVSQPTDQVTHLDFGEIEDIAWSEKCRSLAVMYSGMGQHEEALFWLNAGIEAFFDEGFKMISEELGKPELLDEISSPKAFWLPADEVVTSQFPDMVGKINWPDDKIHVSMYAKLKFLYKNYNMKTSVKKLQKEYRVISKNRNDLFHGKEKVGITPETIQKALQSFAWIKENFKLASE
ncbi:MAG: hypothetical protein ACR2PX_01465 [Endozoicomonas sp.]|uniref:hypothetical protein n=1 Tax=Endozoicomonas sp. TaxID=1892382 RepID=UPI003D9BC8A2